MPILYAKIKLSQNDTGGIKGEELDYELADMIEELDIEGYDIAVSISRETHTKVANDIKEHLRGVIGHFGVDPKDNLYFESDKASLIKALNL